MLQTARDELYKRRTNVQLKSACLIGNAPELGLAEGLGLPSAWGKKAKKNRAVTSLGDQPAISNL